MSRIHCERCLRPQAHCLCPLIPSLDSRTRVLLLQHPSEVRHALNTAKLAALGLRNAQLQVGEVFEDLAELLEAPGYRSVLLFPGDEAQPLVAYGDDQDDRPWQLVVPDGTWRKASKLLHLNPLLGALPRVTLAQVQPSRYRLRKAPQPGALSTLEAVVQALNVLEAPQNFDALLKPFEALIEGQIAAMGRETYERNHLR
ncbi:DTW domain-containing protein [Pseudomonas wadenswilerensis]|uniref:tRNA-uridine aminocarboxypropyltransferase n=1 Tax=Pseudomonas wadenswilerensis TaxID=1785161 RepID=A0A380T552_9PSED|nr:MULTISPECIES: DTW domain-containing protein [Pseudomonas]MCE5980660.1 DTW domain-containing protein [Pseudomonas sp. LF19]SPO67966.1 DTW domain-containing protein [Pseudomonas sp. JV241A]SUQ64648.1 DTW domain-containing protein 2 [Pseudomonas wadenswilerensis]